MIFFFLSKKILHLKLLFFFNFYKYDLDFSPLLILELQFSLREKKKSSFGFFDTKYDLDLALC